ncbi:hypothetical protein M9458_056656 [Cirrhinus mrigala]|uniref:Uncharacterized protein n=1 Tax=Cirrhinus mrigala TaxID=683832 RepID=A0ABD0MHC3_CIRMR
MDPPASRLPHPITEYSATKGTSCFSSRQWPDKQPLKSKLIREGPRSSLAAFMDFALLCVGVVEKERDNAVMAAAKFSRRKAPGHSSVLISTPVCKPIREREAAPECAHRMAATAEPFHKMLATRMLHYVTAVIPDQVRAALPKSSPDTAVVPESSKIKAVVPVSSPVTAVVYEPSKVKAVVPVSSPVTAVVSEPSKVKAVVPVSSPVTAVVSEPCKVTSAGRPGSSLTSAGRPGSSPISAVHRESSHISAGLQESRYVKFDHPEPHHVLSDIWKSQRIMMASVMDPATRCCSSPNGGRHLVRASSVHESAPEATSVHGSAPGASSAHESSPVASSGHKSAPEALSSHKPAPVPPEVAAPTAEPPEGVAPSANSRLVLAVSKLSAHPITAKEVVSELSAHPVTAMEAVIELFACPVTAIEAVIELSAPSVSAKDIVYELSASSDPTETANRLFSLPLSLLLCLPLLSLSLAHPALPVLSQSPGPPHGPGPPTFTLSLTRPTAPLDCLLFGVSESRSLGEGGGVGYVMNLAGDLRSTHHQISPSHSIDIHIIQTVAPHPGLRFPSSTALITCIQSESLYKPWTSSCILQSIVLC